MKAESRVQFDQTEQQWRRLAIRAGPAILVFPFLEHACPANVHLRPDLVFLYAILGALSLGWALLAPIWLGYAALRGYRPRKGTVWLLLVPAVPLWVVFVVTMRRAFR